ncbi:MAG: DUF4920 domain-containing protein [Polyangiales bacterium]
MKRASLLILVGLFGCIRENPHNTPQVQPESASQTAAQVAPSQAAPTQAVAQPEPAPPAAGGSAAAQHFGEAITLTESTALAAIAQNPSRFSGQTVRTEGVVSAVCQSRGCWMQISDAEQRVHVRMHGHSFFVPRDSTGRRARVQGTVVGGTPNGHCEQEAAEATGHQAAERLELDATGVELL